AKMWFSDLDVLDFDNEIIAEQLQAEIMHTIKRYIHIGHNLNEDEKIQVTISDLRRTSVANIESIYNNYNIKTISVITQLFYFEWLINNVEEAFKLNKGWTLKNNINKTDQMTAKNIIKQLQILAREGEFQVENIFNVAKVTNWFA
ncbi:7421_t:CDS:2, partial [Cetraspora pellucida]